MTIEFSPLRSKRLSVTLTEIPIGDAVSLAAIPPRLHEAQTTAFLKYVVTAETPSPMHVADPRAWTVQERAMVVAHYLGHVSETGADFELGGGRYSDYLDAAKSEPVTIEAGVLGDDIWSLAPMIGAAAEAIEMMITPGERSEFNWLLACMAAQLRRPTDVVPDPVSDVAFGDWLRARIAVFDRYPEGEFIQLVILYREALARAAHIFRIDSDDEGIVFMPKDPKAKLPSVRFPADSLISDFAKGMGGKLPE